MNANHCHILETSRWARKKIDDKGSRKVLLFPTRLQLQRKYTSAIVATHMRWHAKQHTKEGEMSHMSEVKALLNFNVTNPLCKGN